MTTRSREAATRSSRSIAPSSPTRSSRRTTGLLPGAGEAVRRHLVTRDPYKVVRRHRRRRFSERQLPHPRRLLSALRRVLRLGHQLLDPPESGDRGRAEAPGQVRIGCARHDLAAAEQVVLPLATRQAGPSPNHAGVEPVNGRVLPTPTEGQPIPPARARGSRVRTTAFATCGRLQPNITSRSAIHASSVDSTRSPHSSTLSSPTCPIARRTPALRCG